MFRTVCVTAGERLSIKDQWLCVAGQNGENRVPVDDLYSVVIDNACATLTVAVITRLTQAGAHIIVCDEKHQPTSVILPESHHYRPLNVVRKQLSMRDSTKDALWAEVIRAKIRNQANVLRLCGGLPDRAERLSELADEVEDGDTGNREGIAAKMFFREMYGSSFVRMQDDAINAALNYGYTVIRSAFCKTLVAYGYYCVVGIHHINESNPFNLADDMMEPLRPLVDMWVDDHSDELLDALTREQRNELAALVNATVLCGGKKMSVRNAIDAYICSLTSAIERGKPELLKIPEIVRVREDYEEEDGDD